MQHECVALAVIPIALQVVVSALRQQLEPAFVPRRVVFVDALPRGPLVA